MLSAFRNVQNYTTVTCVFVAQSGICSTFEPKRKRKTLTSYPFTKFTHPNLQSDR